MGFQKGHIVKDGWGFQKGKKPPRMGKFHHMWMGDKISYKGVHIWVKRKYGKPDTCEHCGKTGLKGIQIHWANKNRKYKRDRKDWMRLCILCHRKYDKEQKVKRWKRFLKGLSTTPY